MLFVAFPDAKMNKSIFFFPITPRERKREREKKGEGVRKGD